MRFQAAIFDLFGTLIPPYSATQFYHSLDRMAAALDIDPQSFRKRWCHGSWQARVTGRYGSLEAEVRAVVSTLEVEPTREQLAEATGIRRAFTKAVLTPRPDAVETLQALKAAGLRLALVSDCTAEVPEVWPETPFAGLIDVPIFSCAAGYKKPDPRIYRLACTKLDVPPHHCFYTGDGFSRELSGAAALGMHAILLQPPGESVADDPENESSIWNGPRVERLSELLSAVMPLP